MNSIRQTTQSRLPEAQVWKPQKRSLTTSAALRFAVATTGLFVASAATVTAQAPSHGGCDPSGAQICGFL